MKNITVFTVFVIILLCHTPANAREQQAYAVTLSPLSGFVSGYAEEIVYPSSEFFAPLLSLLLWDMKPVFYYGLMLELSRFEPMKQWGFFSRFSLKNGIPGSSGYHENRDWQSYENANLTHFSRHDNNTRELFLMDFSAGVSIPLNRVFLLQAYAHLSFMRFSFFGTDGYAEYARLLSPSSLGFYHPITDEPDRFTFKGKVINYTQEWLYAAPGISLAYHHNDLISVALSFIASPLIVCAALDEHKERDNQFRDHMSGGMLFEPGLSASLAVSGRLAVTLEISWRYISGTRGESYQRKPIGFGDYFQNGEAGAGLSVFNVCLGLNVNL